MLTLSVLSSALVILVCSKFKMVMKNRSFCKFLQVFLTDCISKAEGISFCFKLLLIYVFPFSPHLVVLFFPDLFRGSVLDFPGGEPGAGLSSGAGRLWPGHSL